MNAVEIIQRVRAAGAEIALEGDRLVVVGQTATLPEELKQAVRQHTPELMVALGAPMDRTVAAVLGHLRPHLGPALQKLSDDKLLALVNWHIMVAWQRVMRDD